MAKLDKIDMRNIAMHDQLKEKVYEDFSRLSQIAFRGVRTEEDQKLAKTACGYLVATRFMEHAENIRENLEQGG